ncbi:fungal-specific transcription factor domain-containing protein [Aspergillus unguis]
MNDHDSGTGRGRPRYVSTHYFHPAIRRLEKLGVTTSEPPDLQETDPLSKNTDDLRDREVEDASSAAGQTKCSICQSTFRRPEHLKRHFRSHTKEKPFECTQCGRHFSRTDTLHRHELSHHTIGSDGGKDRTHRITVKTFRACYKCALARVRCSGGTPCTRCENRSLECRYPTERRSKAKTEKGTAQTLPLKGNDLSTFSAAEPGASQNKTNRNSFAQPEFQMGQFQLQISDNPSTSSPDAIVGPRMRTHARNSLETGQEVHFTTSPPVDRSDVTVAPEVIPQHFPSFAGANHQFYPEASLPQVQDLPVDHRRLSYALEGRQNEISEPGIVPGMLGSDNQHTQMDFSQQFLGQAAAPPINWLSNDLFLEPSSGRGLTSEAPHQPFQTGVFDDSLNHSTWLPPVIRPEPHGSSLSESISQTTPSGTTSSGDVESPGHSVRGLRHSSQSAPSKRPTDNGTDGQSGRTFKSRRRQSSWPAQTAESLDIFLKFQNTNSNPHFSFPQAHELQTISSPDTSADCSIDFSTYDKIHDAFFRICCTENFLYPVFQTNAFPDVQTLSNFLRHYFHFYHPLYPIIHVPKFNPNKCHWIFTLALAAMGSHSANLCEQNGTATAFDEFLRRVLHVEKEKAQYDPPLWLIQSMLLSCIGRLHGSGESVQRSALSDFGDLCNLAACENMLVSSDGLASDQVPPEEQWTLWSEEEARRRTGYMIWLVDCTIAYEFETQRHFSLDDGQAPLPCNEKIWHAASSRIWQGLHEEASDQEKVSLYDAVLILYIEKRLIPDIGEFSHILLIHALYQRMWEVGDHFRRPLSFWNPTAKKQSRKLAIPSGSVWLPGIASYSKWRNSACDCLDILHWTANGTIAKANGHEHPTILHLHTSRIILLAPFREIRTLASFLATKKVKWEDRQQVIEWHYVLRWIKHDQYKARLAVIHAGSVLYHVRKYSTNAFHEPVATYLAILTLWAYGLCYTPVTSDAAGARRVSSAGPSVINLDQPCSDELVQSFVRAGQMMKGMLTDVGDICAPHGPQHILRVGCETLSRLRSWGIAKGYMLTLMRLAE